MSETMKIIDEKETQKKKKKKSRRDGSYSNRVRDKWFGWVFKFGFHQLICKASLIFKANFESALSIIFKERELYESKHVAVDCRSLKMSDLLSILLCSSILVLKSRQVSPI